jgi:hypothetical protein
LDATPLFACMSRLIRSRQSNREHPVDCKARPFHKELQTVQRIAKDAGCRPFMILMDPNTPSEMQQRTLNRWSMLKSRRVGGKPSRRRATVKARWKPVALKLAARNWTTDMIVAEIARRSNGRVRPSRSTVWTWVRQQ